MPDDKSKKGKQDDSRININHDCELRDWSKRFRVTPQQIKEAIKAVAPMAEDVRRHLRSDKIRKG